MNRAIWKKAVADAWRQLAVSSVLLVAFTWLFVWLMAGIDTRLWRAALRLMPKVIEPTIGIPIQDLASPLGQVSIIYVHVITLLICVGWALGRGSQSISGEIGRGTMDLILTLPVRRVTVMAVPAVVAALGTAVLVAAVWLGTALAIRHFPFDGTVSAGQFLPGAINLFAMTFCLTGITTFISSWSNDRWRTLAWSGGFFIASLILKIGARLWPAGLAWLNYLTFLSAFEPQKLILLHDPANSMTLRYNGTLLAVGLLGYLIAAIIFTWRDIPAPR